MRRRYSAAVATLTAASSLALVAANTTSVGASSHREAPLISQDAIADNTDLYLFRDPVDPSMVTIIANYVGLQQPAAGPNFYRFGDDVLYEIHVDNNGDVVPDITYQFRFRTQIGNPETFLYNTGPITGTADPDHNIRQFYSVRRVDRNRSGVIAQGEIPPSNIGPRSTPNYESLATQYIANMSGGGRVFAGERSDPFYVDLGSVFDLLGIRVAPFNNAHAIDQPAEPARDGLADKNVMTIALQVPISSLLRAREAGTDPKDPGSIIGVYASASRQRLRVMPGEAAPAETRWLPVSRLGLPLVNEVLIPLEQKDRWNASLPRNDVAKFGQYILDPEPTKLLPVLYGEAYAANDTTKVPPGGIANRPDLVLLLTGQLIGAPAGSLAPADLLRLNVAVPPDTADQNVMDDRLGALVGDPAGFPNGRRLRDDVVDIELRVLAGVLLGPQFADGPNNLLTDGVNATGNLPYRNTFPYVGSPISGWDQNDGFTRVNSSN
jgi:hypothetical protein